MTIDELKEEISKILKKHFNWNGREWILDEQGIDESASTDDFDDFVADLSKYIAENYQPKTTSTDIEELRKEFEERVIGETFAGGIFNDNDNQRMYTSGYADGFRSAKGISWRWFAPHLSNKSELKKEAVQEFMEFCWDGGEHDGWIIAKADEYFSSNEKEEGEKQ